MMTGKGIKKSQICSAVSKARVPESIHYFKISYSQSMYKIQLQYLFYETCILGAENLRWHAKHAACICTIENCVLHRIFSAYCKTYFLLVFYTRIYMSLLPLVLFVSKKQLRSWCRKNSVIFYFFTSNFLSLKK